jgi:hypothetical protein
MTERFRVGKQRQPHAPTMEALKGNPFVRYSRSDTGRDAGAAADI